MKIKNILIVMLAFISVISVASAAKKSILRSSLEEEVDLKSSLEKQATCFPKDIAHYASSIPPRTVGNAIIAFKEITSFAQAKELERIASNWAIDELNDRELKYQWLLLAKHCDETMLRMKNEANEKQFKKLQAENTELRKKADSYQSIAQKLLNFITANFTLKDLMPQVPGGPREDDQLSMEKNISENHGK